MVTRAPTRPLFGSTFENIKGAAIAELHANTSNRLAQILNLAIRTSKLPRVRESE
jgi:hypothetical protein